MYGPQSARLGRGREPAARAEGSPRARSFRSAPAQGQRPDADVPDRHRRPDRGERARLLLGGLRPGPRRARRRAGLLPVRGRAAVPRRRCATRTGRSTVVHVDVHARRHRRTSAATCSSSGSSATTSRTRSAACGSSSSTCSPASRRRRSRPSSRSGLGTASDAQHPERRRERSDRGRARRVLRAPPAGEAC